MGEAVREVRECPSSGASLASAFVVVASQPVVAIRKGPRGDKLLPGGCRVWLSHHHDHQPTHRKAAERDRSPGDSQKEGANGAPQCPHQSNKEEKELRRHKRREIWPKRKEGRGAAEFEFCVLMRKLTLLKT